MNKKLLPFLFSCLFLFSCNNKVEDKIPLFTSEATLQQVDGETEYLVNKLYENEFDTMIQKKMSFPLFVYAAGCGSCDNFSIVLKDYIRLHHVVFPYMTLGVFNLAATKTPSLSDSALLFYKNGVLTKSIDNILDQVFTTSDLEKIMNKECIETNISYLAPSYTYFNSKTPFWSYHFSDYFIEVEEKENEMRRDYFDKTKNQTILFLKNDSFSYSSLYQELRSSSYDSFVVSNDSLQSISSFFGTSIVSDVLKLEFKNGLLSDIEPITIH